MSRSTIMAVLQEQAPALKERFGARTLGLFGSAARDELRSDSDVDVLVEFEGNASFDAYFGLKDALETALGRRVDLVSAPGLKPRARQQVQRDLIRVS